VGVKKLELEDDAQLLKWLDADATAKKIIIREEGDSPVRILHNTGDVHLKWLDADTGMQKIIIQEGDSPIHILQSIGAEDEDTETYRLNLEDAEHSKVIEMKIRRDADGDEEDVEIEIVEEEDEAL
jgi:hypothetical protein